MIIHRLVRQHIKEKFGGRCAYCGEKPDKLQIDHIIPRAGGGTDDPSNLMPACFSCNNYKMSMSLEQFRTEIGIQALRARQYSLNFRLAERFGLVEIIKDKPVQFYFEKEPK